MTEILFYHLERATLESVLPGLLEKSLERGWRAVVRAGSRAEAASIAERDPMHKSGARRFTVRPWMINEGTVTIRFDSSSQTFSIL